MDEELQDQQDRTEQPTDERREEFRKRGEVAHSREITSVAVLLTTTSILTVLGFYGFNAISALMRYFFASLMEIESDRIFLARASTAWTGYLKLILPMFGLTAFVAILVTMIQTQMNFSFERLKPNLSKISPLKGFKRIFSGQSAMELAKSIAKLIVVSIMLVTILYSEQRTVPALMNVPTVDATSYTIQVASYLIWSVAGLMLLIAGVDYFYNFRTLEQKMRMTKRELKEELKKREVDPMVKGRIRKMQRDLAFRRTVEATRNATVVITNPTHLSCALKYEKGMAAPELVAKGSDYLAMRMREVARDNGIPIVEQKPLARKIYHTMEVGESIPYSLYRAVSEVIRYVYRTKGVKLDG